MMFRSLPSTEIKAPGAIRADWIAKTLLAAAPQMP